MIEAGISEVKIDLLYYEALTKSADQKPRRTTRGHSQNQQQDAQSESPQAQAFHQEEEAAEADPTRCSASAVANNRPEVPAQQPPIVLAPNSRVSRTE
ncbi:MAG: hypothetical protein ABIU05_27010 [Nitrospirales bacterium]